MKQKSVQDLSVLGHFAKTDVRYWQETIFRQTYTRNGETLVTKNWAMKIAHLCRRETRLRSSFYTTTIFTSFINSETRVVSWQGGCLGRSAERRKIGVVAPVTGSQPNPVLSD
jgi:hypothetical protein